MIQKLVKRKTLKAKIIQYNFIVICMMAIFVSVCTYLTANEKTMQIAKNSLEFQVSAISSRFQLAYEEMRNIILNIAGRKSFELPQKNPYTSPNVPNSGVRYVTQLSDYCAVTGYGQYISKLSVFNRAGAVVQTGTSYGRYLDAQNLIDAPWFEEELKKNMDLYYLDIVESPFYKEQGKILPIICPLGGINSISETWVALCISDRLFEDVLSANDTGQETIVVTSTGNRIAAMHEPPDFMEENDRIVTSLFNLEDKSGLLEMKVHGKNSFVAYERSLQSGIMVYRVVPADTYKSDSLLVIQTVFIMFGACVIFGLLLSVVFTNQLRNPIDRLVDHIQKIAGGDFSQDSAIEGEDEIGRIGVVINGMSGQVERLMEQRLEDADEKNRLELKMLQAQINPHFLYNTLDSIKWIAVIQKNSGIVKGVTALSSLLKNMAKGVHEKIVLKQELDFLADYITIEKLKYAELFDVVTVIEDPKLYQAKIIKLTLQPLVENAIFKGIEPVGKNGTVWIRAFERDNSLYITVRDNGRGISKTVLESMLTDTVQTKKNHMSGIGLTNVDRRIKLTYGEEYGLEIESEEGVYTEISIHMPLEY